VTTGRISAGTTTFYEQVALSVLMLSAVVLCFHLPSLLCQVEFVVWRWQALGLVMVKQTAKF
jgi:hypothetical protein